MYFDKGMQVAIKLYSMEILIQFDLE